MPVFTYLCPVEKVEFRKMLPKVEDFVACKCGAKSGRKQVSVPGVSVYEHLDNGSMARAIDRPADAQRIFAERAEQHKREMQEDIEEDDLEPINHEGEPVG